jgi:hypothetical protein
MAARNKPAGIRSLVYGIGKDKAGIEGLSVSSLGGAEIDCLLCCSPVSSYPLIPEWKSRAPGGQRKASRLGQCRETLELAAHSQYERGAKLISTNLLSLLLIPSFREVQK